MPDPEAEEPARRLDEVHVDRDRWKARALDAERRYREREVALRQLREDLDSLRRDRDSWREQTERLAGALPPLPASRADPVRVRALAKRTIRAAWEIMPEPGRRLARPFVARVRGWAVGGLVVGGLAELQLAPPAQPVPGGELPEAGPATAIPPHPLPVRESISVVIPTLNGGPGFARTLDAILLQEEVAGVELLVVDSGSSDGTPDLARSRGARVVEIPGEEFSHGGTRDRMAAMARGEILVMTVQDAVLVGRDALARLVRLVTSDPTLAAVSARQVPRLECDLFGAFIMFTHARATLGAPAASAGGSFATLTLPERRALCAVDNVCAAIRREAWEALRFRDLPFAEDLDFGLRAVEQGWKVATANDVCVVHSHDRTARYHLGRFLIDRLTVSAFLGDPDRSPASLTGLEVVAASAVKLLGQVEGARAVVDPGKRTVAFAAYTASVAAELGHGAAAAWPAGELGEIAHLLAADAEPDPEPDPEVVAALREGVIDLLQAPSLKEFAESHPFVERADADVFIGRAAALVLGGVLGDSMRDTFPDTPLATRLRQGI